MNEISSHIYFNGFAHLDYHINKKHTLGFRVRAKTNYRKEENTVKTNYCFLNSSIVDSSDVTDNVTKSQLKMKTPNYSISANLNYNITFNPKQKLTFDLDYNHYLSDIPY